ncbi:MAG: hypothetical protein ACFFCW_13600 [Candidatus Hodarchaeota archaeon]
MRIYEVENKTSAMLERARGVLSENACFPLNDDEFLKRMSDLFFMTYMLEESG